MRRRVERLAAARVFGAFSAGRQCRLDTGGQVVLPPEPMRNAILVCSTLALSFAAACGSGGAQTSETVPSQQEESAQPTGDDVPAGGGLTYPAAAKGDVVDAYHGTKVADPYRWLEDDVRAPRRRALGRGREQGHVRLPRVDPRSASAIKERLTELWNYEKLRRAVQGRRPLLLTKNDGLQNQSVLYVHDVARRAEPRVLLDPNTLSQGRHGRPGRHWTSATTASSSPTASPTAGSDWQEWQRARRRHRQGPARTTLKWVKFSGAVVDARRQGLLLQPLSTSRRRARRSRALNLNQKLYYHRARHAAGGGRAGLRAAGPAGVGLRRRASPTTAATWSSPSAKGTDDRSTASSTRTCSEPDAHGRRADRRLRRTSTASSATTARCSTSRPTSTRRAAGSSPSTSRKPDREHWKEIIPQATETLRRRQPRRRPVRRATTCKDAHDAGQGATTLDGKLVRDVELPGHRHGRRLRRQARRHGDVLHLHQLHHAAERSTATTSRPARARCSAQPKVDFDPTTTRRSRSSTRARTARKVPMFITHKKGLKLDGNEPDAALRLRRLQHLADAGVLSVEPRAWMEMGGVLAVAEPARRRRVRRGLAPGRHEAQEAERVRRLHRRGRVADREQVHVARRSWRSRAAATAACSSAPCMTQRPDLFGAALPAVGVMDMLRFHKFTIGWAWVDDYGSSDDAGRVQGAATRTRRCTTSSRARRYPPTLVTTADHDDRVVPGHSFKFAAALQAAPGGRRPGPDPHRDQGRPRRGQADDEDDRGGRRPAGLPGQDLRDAGAAGLGALRATEV